MNSGGQLAKDVELNVLGQQIERASPMTAIALMGQDSEPTLLKGKLKAAEKVVSVYGGDVSLLKDVCRQTIVFESVDDLTRCLEALLADDEMVVERINNRLDPAASAYQTLGFRSLVVNLRIDVDMTRKLGIETHVCELQLTLRDIYDKSRTVEYEEYRKDYLAVRGALKSRRPWSAILSTGLWPRFNSSSSSQSIAVSPRANATRLPRRVLHLNRIAIQPRRTSILFRRMSEMTAEPKSRPPPPSRKWQFLLPEGLAEPCGALAPTLGMAPSSLASDDSGDDRLRRSGDMYKPSLAGLFSEDVHRQHAGQCRLADADTALQVSAGPGNGAVSSCRPPRSLLFSMLPVA